MTELIHLFCCDPNAALCGVDLTDATLVAYRPNQLCDRCYLIDTWREPCPLCAAVVA